MANENNPFSKPSSFDITPTYTPSADVLAINKFLLNKCPNVVLTVEEQKYLDTVDRPKKIEWLKAKLIDTNYQKVFDVLSKGDVFKNIKDPLEITSSDLDELMSQKTDDEMKTEMRAVNKEARSTLLKQLVSDYVSKRNLLKSDGTVDTFISAAELRVLEREADKQLKDMSKTLVGVNEGDKLAGLVNTFNDMSIDSKYAYEGFKEGICNDFGITPDSFDRFMAAVIKDNTDKLTSEGINIRTDLYDVKAFHKKNAHLLEKVKGWKRGDIVYRSEFNAKLREKEDAELKNGHGTEESKKLFQEMLANTYHDLKNPVKLKKSHVTKDAATDFIRARKKNRHVSVKLEPEVTETKNVEEIVQPQPKKVDLDQFLHDDVPAATENKTVDDGSITTDDIAKMLEEIKQREAAVALAEKKLQEQKEHNPVVETETAEEAVANTVDQRGPRLKYSGSEIDNLSVVREYPADSSILRKPGNRLEIVKQYKESARRGRTLFLPNSNYEVYVKKIKSTDSINYMMTLINNTKDINLVESYVKQDIMRICYENIEFPFEEHVSYTDFIKCLHESDMTLLMVMLALVNIPEDENGKIPLEIASVMCTNPECGAIGHFKQKLKLDLKEEFVNIYPVDRYATLYAAYKNADFKSIYQAYRSSEIGKLSRESCKDELLEYSYLLSAPTVFKRESIKAARDEVSYKRLLDRLENRAQTMDDNKFTEVIDYMKSHTYYEFSMDMLQVSSGEVDVTDDDKRVLMILSDELSQVKNDDTPFYLIMDVIDSMDVTTLDGDVVVENLDQTDVYTLIGMLEQAPKQVLDDIIAAKNATLDKSYPVDIVFEAEDVAGKFDFDGYYGTDEEMVAEITKRHPKATPEELQIIIETQRKIRNDSKPPYENEGICFCGSKTWKLNYTGILFFWMSNQLETRVK